MVSHPFVPEMDGFPAGSWKNKPKYKGNSTRKYYMLAQQMYNTCRADADKIRIAREMLY